MYGGRTLSVFLIVVSATLVSTEHDPEGDGQKPCTDDEGNVIPDGQEFMPKFSDPCTKCTCDNGYAIMCHTAACSPPVGCVRIEQVPRECCKYHCLDADGKSRSPSANDSTPLDGHPTSSDDNITNLSLRLVASTVTSFLVLALLLFMVHRLRQRRLMMAMRRFEAQARSGHGDDDLDHYIPSEFMPIECPPYEDPPPPYSPPKPPHILPEDAPPPYEEVENNNTTGSELDTNANVNNNNNNNQSCDHDRGGDRAGEDQHNAVIENQRGNPNGAHIADILAEFNTLSERHQSACIPVRYVEGGVTGNGHGVDQTYRKSLAAVGESCDQEGRGSGGVSRGVGECEWNTLRTAPAESGGGLVTSCADPVEAAVAVRELHAQGSNPDSRPRSVRQPGRSCSFSYTRSSEQDEIAAVALAPMSHSYHAATADSGVQTLGSYTASLSRRKTKASNPVQSRHTISEAGEVSSGQRMIRKPIFECDSSIQNSHRLLQEELLRSLPPMQGGIGDQAASGPRPNHRPSPSSAPVDSCGNISPRPEPDGDDFSSPDHHANSAGPIPRSQSVTSTFSVCSETGEVRKKPQAEGDGSVLQSDCQYPEHRRPSLRQAQTLEPAVDLFQPSGNRTSTSESNGTKGVPHASATDSCAGRSEPTGARVSVGPGVRRPVTNPPSQELRPGMASGRSHTLKQKHGKKIHFVPLEKSKTFKQGKREKGKASKKSSGAADPHSDHTPRVTSGEGASVVLDPLAAQELSQYSTEVRVLPSKTTDVKRSRSSAQPSVKQYGFLDHYVNPSAQPVGHDNEFETSGRPPEYGFEQKNSRAGANPFHSLPHQPHSHGTRASHPAGHRRQLSHPAEKGCHVNPATLRPKLKPRPHSGGPTVEPGCDPIDPVAALPQNSIPRRRVKNVHAKKSRQSYPAQESGHCVDRKVPSGIDLGFVEPGQDYSRNPLADQDGAAFSLASKRRNGERNGERGGAHNLFTNGPFVESHMSSYV